MNEHESTWRSNGLVGRTRRYIGETRATSLAGWVALLMLAGYGSVAPLACTKDRTPPTTAPARARSAPADSPTPTPFAAKLFKPRAVSVAPDGRVFVVDMSGQVFRFSAAGVLELQWEVPGHAAGNPSGLFVDADSRVWVPDTHNHRVLLYDADGHELARFGRQGTGGGEFILPNDVVVDEEGCVYVTEYGGNDRISKFTPELHFVQAFGTQKDGPATLCTPYGMCLDGAQTLWVADSGNHRICHFSREGELLGTFGGLGDKPGSFRYPYDVAWVGPGNGPTPDGNLLICDKANQRLALFTPQGVCRGLWGQPGRGTGQLNQPTGVAVLGNGKALVADTGNHRLSIVLLKDFRPPR